MKIFKPDNKYFEQVQTYTKKDAHVAIIFYLMMLIIYFIMGYVYKVYHTNLDIIINVLLVIACIIIVKCRKHKLSSLGITKNKFIKSLTLGLITGIIIAILNNTQNSSNLSNIKSLGIILFNSFYYFIIIGFTEEVIFRGYIQTRMYALIKNEVICVAVVGMLFMLMHVPFRIFTSNLDLNIFLSDNYISVGMTFIWHFAFNYLYMKYNSIVAPTVFHGFMNLSSQLFY